MTFRTASSAFRAIGAILVLSSACRSTFQSSGKGDSDDTGSAGTSGAPGATSGDSGAMGGSASGSESTNGGSSGINTDGTNSTTTSASRGSATTGATSTTGEAGTSAGGSAGGDTCEINGVSYASGTRNPEQSECQVCDPARSNTEWSSRDEDPCDDGLYCTVDDQCADAVCTGVARECSDGVSCNGVESCDEASDACAAGTPTCTGLELCDTSSDSCVVDCSGCAIAGSCIANGSTNPVNPCEVCDITRAIDGYSANDGAVCGNDATACSAQDTCSAGVCVPNDLAAGTECGSASTECSDQDTCDSKGACLPNHFGTTKTCGSAAADCVRQDYCDGNGGCRDNGFDSAGTACSSNANTDCSSPDTCNASGVCQPNHRAVGTACGSAPDACKLQATCNSSGSCGAQGNVSQGTECELDDDPATIEACNASGSCVSQGAYCSGYLCWRVPPTAQTSCFDNTKEITCPGAAGSASCGSTAFCGQDAQYADAPRTFTCKDSSGATKSCTAAAASGDVVEDSLTGLTWQRVLPTNYGSVCGNQSECEWQPAIDYCSALSYGGASDWRLPDHRELLSVLDYEAASQPTSVLPGMTTATYFASTLHLGTGMHAYMVFFAVAYSNVSALDQALAVRCVRGGPSGTEDRALRFATMGTAPEQVVFDRATGLYWQYERFDNVTWQESLALCESADYGGYSDWRIPHENEIYSLVNYVVDQAPTTDFPNFNGYDYWSSTTKTDTPTDAYTARFNYGYHTHISKTSEVSSRCVRGGP